MQGRKFFFPTDIDVVLGAARASGGAGVSHGHLHSGVSRICNSAAWEAGSGGDVPTVAKGSGSTLSVLSRVWDGASLNDRPKTCKVHE